MEQKTEAEVEAILSALEELYPNPETALEYENTFQLLIAVILSAQTTDKQVNKITNELFNEFKKPADIADLSPEELEPHIQGLGLYRNKSKYIVQTCRKLVEEYEGQVPRDRKELMKLSGVGRKTANVVSSCAFGEDAIAVDTHVFRVSNRLGLADSDKVKEVEQQLMEVIPQDKWSLAHHWLIFHGRETCKARSPRCEDCELHQYCNYYQQ
ncbi:endonuclease III [Halanaerobacter jeridensis]|uniref:Endonuclease III n=1 Tax=Halanaerobacter jeridensis TaxID=706427 RepID=A0A938XNB1_9FIRM|nr:endonuclease III [Halanaerobacter jeridensis]MBM7555523.1 endonuclease-3 [Halanaerobacter jeridensis]